MAALPFGKQLTYLEPLENPRSSITNMELFSTEFGRTKLFKLWAHLEFEVKDLIGRVSKLGYGILHQSISGNPECLSLITSLKTNDYDTAWNAVDKRFAPFKATERRNAQSV